MKLIINFYQILIYIIILKKIRAKVQVSITYNIFSHCFLTSLSLNTNRNNLFIYKLIVLTFINRKKALKSMNIKRIDIKKRNSTKENEVKKIKMKFEKKPENYI